MADKIAKNQELQEEKLDRMIKLDYQRDEQLRVNVIKVEEERIRQKEALERAKSEQITNVLKDTLAAKEKQLHFLELGELRRQQDAESRL